MDRGGQLGNQKAVKGKLITDALQLALNREAEDADGKPTKRLALIAEKVASMAIAGEPWAWKLQSRLGTWRSGISGSPRTIQRLRERCWSPMRGGIPPGRRHSPRRLVNSARLQIL